MVPYTSYKIQIKFALFKLYIYIVNFTINTFDRSKLKNMSVTSVADPDPYIFPGSVSKVGLIQQKLLKRKENKSKLRTEIVFVIDLNFPDYILKSDSLFIYVNTIFFLCC